MAEIRLRVNGRDHRIDVPPGESLLTVLRTELDLTGAKYGCGEGQCGACTVLVDGQAVRSCVAPASSVAGKSITTIEGTFTTPSQSTPSGRSRPRWARSVVSGPKVPSTR